MKPYPDDAISRASALAERIDRERDKERRWQRFDYWVMPLTVTLGMVLVGVMVSISVLLRGI